MLESIPQLVDISIHAAREGGDLTLIERGHESVLISIHAAREGGDTASLSRFGAARSISIHAAREGGDCPTLRPRLPTVPFQSTPPVKAATHTKIGRSCSWTFQSTPPVKAATRGCRPSRKLDSISIHAAREGGDFIACGKTARAGRFQSTPPVKAATY